MSSFDMPPLRRAKRYYREVVRTEYFRTSPILREAPTLPVSDRVSAVADGVLRSATWSSRSSLSKSVSKLAVTDGGLVGRSGPCYRMPLDPNS
jgi:hypothetical protein